VTPADRTETGSAGRAGSSAAEARTSTTTRSGGTPIAVRVVYVLGIVAATVLAASLLFVVVAYATTGSGGFGLDVSVPALVVWLGIVIAAGGTWVWRRFGAAR